MSRAKPWGRNCSGLPYETRVESIDAHVAPVWLGQLHGAELPRTRMAAAAENFCLTYGAIYRPHPAETDRASRRQHQVWKDKGIRFGENAPLSQTRNPIVSIFSTGVIEAAAMGLPSWVSIPTRRVGLRSSGNAIPCTNGAMLNQPRRP
ncbi:MAG: hypothetical protein V9E81_11075 [Marmoricola sp.]